MTKKSLVLCSLLPLLQLAPLHAKLAADAPALALNAPSGDSPLLMREFYPRWSAMDPSKAEAEMTRLIKISQEKIASLVALKPEQMTYANTFGVMERIEEDIEACFISIYQLSTVADSPLVRSTLKALNKLADKNTAEVIANEALWAALKTAAQQPWVAQQSPEHQRFIQQTIEGFQDSGADLSQADKATLAKLRSELSQLGLQYGKNVLDSTNAWEHVVTDPSQLKGMTENWMNTAAAAALKKGYGTKDKPQWLITLSYPSYGPIMADCEVEATRRLCWQAATKIGRLEGKENEPLVARIALIRQQMAQLLGHKNFADLKAKRRMVTSGEQAMQFIDDLRAKVFNAYKKDLSELYAFISERTGQKVDKLNPWDRHYYTKELAMRENSFDPEVLRPYLTAPAMVEGMIALYEELLGLDIREVPTTYISDKAVTSTPDQIEVWHPDVKLYEVYDSSSKKLIGAFYLDIFPRSTKRDGAWFMPIRYGESGRNGKPAYPHLGALVGNFSPPVNGAPAQLSHYDVVVLFHEFGHTLHGMLSDTTLRKHAGTSVAWDFVEMPSQLFEYWAWAPEFLKKHAKHYKTGEPIPDELIAKLRQSKNYRAATQNMGQLNIAKLDLEFHMNYDKHFKGRSLDQASQELLAATNPNFTVPNPSLLHQLEHTMSGGYAAGYFSYKWAEVLCADAFSRFRREGLSNKATGASLRKEILSQGDSKPAAELFENFMGRKPDSDALLIEQGLLPAK